MQSKAKRLSIEQLEPRCMLSAEPFVQFIDSSIDALIGEQVEIVIAFDNQATSDVGYGPYIDLMVPNKGTDGDDGLSYVSGSALYLGTSLSEHVLTFDTAGEAIHPYAKDSNGNSLVINGNPGDQLIVFELPFGSFVSDQPEVQIDLRLDVSELADIGIPLEIQASSGFRYGSDPLDNPTNDPSLIGNLTSFLVTPSLVTVDIVYLGPENETATGENYKQQYRINVDITNGQTITDLRLRNLLPDNIAFSNIVAADPASNVVTIISTPDVGVATNGGEVIVQFNSITGTTATSDAVLLVEFFVPEFDSTGTTILSPTTGDNVLSETNVLATGNWTPIDTRDELPDNNLLFNAADPEHTLTDKSIVIQKHVSLQSDQNSSGLGPGDVLEYRLEFQISDYFAFANVNINDILFDGLRFDSTYTPLLTVSQNGTSTTTLLNQDNFSVTNHWSGAGDRTTPVDGTTKLEFRISDELILDGQNGDLIGGQFDSSSNGGPTTGTLLFRAIIQDGFSNDFPSGDPSVDAGDLLTADVTISGELLNRIDQTPNGNSQADDSSSALRLSFGTLGTSIYAINGNTSFTSNTIAPGDEVTFRIRKTVPSSDFENLLINDYLPLPIFDVTSATTFTATADATIPAVGTAKFGPSDTLHEQLSQTPTFSTNSAGNRLDFDYGDLDDTENRTAEIDILITVVVSDTPTADKLLLTSQAHSGQSTTNAGSFSQDAITQIRLTQPVLKLTKGITASDNPNAQLQTNAGPSGVSFRSPTSSTAFSGIIHSTGLSDTPVDANIARIDADDRVTFTIVIENIGTSRNGAFDTKIRDVIPEGFIIPNSGINLRVTDGTGQPIAYTELPDGLFGDGLALSNIVEDGEEIGSLAAYHETSGKNIVVIAYDLQTEEKTTSNAVLSSNATLFNYASIAGGSDHTATNLTDLATVTIATPIVDKSIIDTSHSHTNGTRVAIGETVTYQVVILIPETNNPNTILIDTLDRGLSIVSLDDLQITDGLLIDHSIVDLLANATIQSTGNSDADQGRKLTLDFGDIDNPFRNNSSVEEITLTYTAIVTNYDNNDRGDRRNNRAKISWEGGSTLDRAPNVRIAEPQLNVVKQVGIGHADANDQITVTIDVSHHNSSDTDAFEITLNDLLPENTTYVAESLHWTGTGLTQENLSVVNGNIFANWTSFLLNDISQLQYEVILERDPLPGQVLTSSTYVSWSSLPGEPGVMSTFNNIAVERTGNPTDIGSEANDYRVTGAGNFTVSSSTLEGTVYVDIDNNGTYSNNESIICDVYLTLTGTNHLGESIEMITFTDGDGKYYFEGLRPGTYTITEEHPEGYFDGLESLGPLGGTIGNDVISQITIPRGSNTTFDNYNFGELSPGSILGTVYIDSDNDGILDHKEIGIPEIAVELTGINDLGEIVSLQQTTASDGTYLFDNLRAGKYGISQTQPNLYFDGNEQLGDAGGTAGDDQFNTILLSYNEDATNYNFAELAPSSLKGFVYIDLDRDGVFDDNDTRLNSVQVTLTGTDDRGNEVNRTTNTLISGAYQFDAMRPGNYSLASASIESLTDGHENIGTFSDNAHPTTANGSIGQNLFSAIQLASGRSGYNYNFAKLDDDHLCGILETEFTATSIFYGTSGNDIFEFIAGYNGHTVRLNGEEFSVDGSESVSVRFFGGDGTDSVTVTGIHCKEQAELRATSGKVIGVSYELRAYSTSSITVDGNGGEDRAYLYDTQGNDTLYATPLLARLSGTSYLSQVNQFHRVYTYATQGNDVARLYDSDLDDTFKATPADARLYNDNFYNYVRNFDSVYAYASTTGNDRAYLWDSSGNDTLSAAPTVATMNGPGYFNHTENFKRVQAYSNAGGEDSAYLYDSSGNDTLYANPRDSRLTGSAFDNRVYDFGLVHAYASTGSNDRAYLYDSHEDDTFVATPTNALLAGFDFENHAHTFDRVYAHSTRGGEDIATLQGSTGDDVYHASPTEARIYGNGFYNATYGFYTVEATASAGYDRAYLYDSTGNDLLISTPANTQLTGHRFNNIAIGFSRVYVLSTAGGHDRAKLYDSSGSDTLKVDVNGARLYGNDYYNLTIGFDCLDAYFDSLGVSDYAWFNGIQVTELDDESLNVAFEQTHYGLKKRN